MKMQIYMLIAETCLHLLIRMVSKKNKLLQYLCNSSSVRFISLVGRYFYI